MLGSSPLNNNTGNVLIGPSDPDDTSYLDQVLLTYNDVDVTAVIHLDQVLI